MKGIGIYLVGLICLLCLNSCTREPGGNMLIVTADTNTMQLIVDVGEHNQFIEVLSQKPDVEDLRQKSNIQYIKKGDNHYSTLVQTSKTYLLLYFNEDCSFANYRVISFSSGTSKIDLKEISIGTQIDVVKKIDPQGDYTFLMHSWSKYPKVSYHYFKDGSGYAVQYDDLLRVISVYEFYI